MSQQGNDQNQQKQKQGGGGKAASGMTIAHTVSANDAMSTGNIGKMAVGAMADTGSYLFGLMAMPFIYKGVRGMYNWLFGADIDNTPTMDPDNFKSMALAMLKSPDKKVSNAAISVMYDVARETGNGIVSKEDAANINATNKAAKEAAKQGEKK